MPSCPAPYLGICIALGVDSGPNIQEVRGNLFLKSQKPSIEIPIRKKSRLRALEPHHHL
jgi:hypothetical protein